jgi:hypothetical protein
MSGCRFFQNQSLKRLRDEREGCGWGCRSMDGCALESEGEGVAVGVGGKQEFRRTDFGSRLLAAEGEGGGGK